MTVPKLSATAQETFNDVTVKLLPIKPVTGTTWNAGELALVYAEITNTSALPLRDVVVDSVLYGSAAKYQSFYKWDGNGGYVGDLEPGEKWTNYIALLKGVSPADFALIVRLAGEVVPYASSSPAWTYYKVHPAP